MSLSRILRGPGISPSNCSNDEPTSRNSSAGDSPLSEAERTPRARHAELPGSAQDSDSGDETPTGSPNPFLIGTPPNAPVAIPYGALFVADPLTSPVLNTPTNPRALRRHGAVALLIPQTPSRTPNLELPSAPVSDDALGLLEATAPELSLTQRIEVTGGNHQETTGEGKITFHLVYSSVV